MDAATLILATPLSVRCRSIDGHDRSRIKHNNKLADFCAFQERAQLYFYQVAYTSGTGSAYAFENLLATDRVSLLPELHNFSCMKLEKKQ